MQIIKILTKSGCTYCSVMKFHLEQEGVNFTEEETKLAAPILLVDDQVVFTGLPPLKDLQDFINSLK
jgi:disulfide oxidoreductase YuzD